MKIDLTIDWTRGKYEQLLEVMQPKVILTVSQWISSQEGTYNDSIVLRHDIDSRPHKALKIARIEADLGIVATYYVRWNVFFHNMETIKAIHKLGHEIGYHYEDLSDTSGDMIGAVSLFEAHLSRMRECFPIITSCAHGAVLSGWDNRTFFERAGNDFGLLDAYNDVDFSQVVYFSDTGRIWRDSKRKIYDKGGVDCNSEVKTTDDLILYLKIPNKDRATYILMHPERWAFTASDYLFWVGRDIAANSVKALLRLYNKANGKNFSIQRWI